jgi:DNA-binding Lrp family transcriptional regulator
MSEKGEKMSLDKIDQLILRDLRDDAHQTYKELANAIGSNINTVASRIKKLEKAGYIKGYNALIDYDKLGYTTSVLVKFVIDEAKHINREDISDIISMPEVVLAYGATGCSDLYVLLKAKNFDDLIEKIGILAKNKHVVNVYSEYIVKEFREYEEFNPLSDRKNVHNGYKKRKKPLSELDIGILREIRSNANEPLRILSKKLNAPISTIKERTDKMEETGIIKGYIANLDFFKLGYWNYQVIGLKLDTNKLNDEKVVNSLLGMKEITTLFRVLGDYDLYAIVLIKDVDEANEILAKISSIDGITKTNSQIALNMFKSKMSHNPLLVSKGK